jgi:transcriptional regulator with XRE-family HTH domain
VAPAPLTVVPAWRLGALLRAARESAGLAEIDLAAQSGRFSADELQAIERGERALDDHEVDALVDLYGIDRDVMVPDRHELVVDLDHHHLAAAGRTQALAGAAPTAEEVLGTYLTLVYTLRAAEPGTPVRLRQADVDVLARALALAVPEVEQRLESLMTDPERVVLHQRSKLLRARVLVPAAGVLVALCVGGALVVSARPSDTKVPDSHAVVTTPTTSGPSTSAAVTPTSAPRVVVGNDLHQNQVPKGDVGLAPAQVVTRGHNGQPVQSDRNGGSTTTTVAG